MWEITVTPKHSPWLVELSMTVANSRREPLKFVRAARTPALANALESLAQNGRVWARSPTASKPAGRKDAGQKLQR